MFKSKKIKRISNFLFSEPFIIAFVSIVMIFINIIPFLYRLLNTPPDRIFTGAQFYTLDYNIYLSHFKEGAEGVFLTHNKHSSEPHNGFLLRREYFLWGFIFGKLLHLPIIYVYHSARIFSGFLLLFTIYLLIKKIIPDNPDNPLKNKSAKTLRIFAFLFSLFISGFPIYQTNLQTGKIEIEQHLFWFLEIDPTQRFATLFHYLLGNIILLFSLLLFLRYLKKINITSNPLSLYKADIKTYLLSILLCWLACLIHPSTLVTIYLLFGLFLFFKTLEFFLRRLLFQETNICKYLKISIYILITLIFSAPSLLFLKNQVSQFPWPVIARWDRVAQTPIDFWDYTQAIGPIFYLGSVGVILFLLKYFQVNLTKKKLQNINLFDGFLLLFCFISATFLLSFKIYPYILDINRVRLLQVPIYVPFAIFSVLAIYEFYRLLVFLLFKISHLSKTKFKLFSPLLLMFKKTTFLSYFIFFVFIASFYLTFPSFLHGIKRETFMFPKGDLLIYPPKSWNEGITWLDKHTAPDKVVMGTFITNGLIPGLSGNYSYSGHPWNTVDFAKKEGDTINFFSGKLSRKDTLKMLKENKVDYLFYGYQEKSLGGNIEEKYGQFLKPVFKTPEVAIFKVL